MELSPSPNGFVVAMRAAPPALEIQERYIAMDSAQTGTFEFCYAFARRVKMRSAFATVFLSAASQWWPVPANRPSTSAKDSRYVALSRRILEAAVTLSTTEVKTGRNMNKSNLNLFS
jgi:hypothetical protein